MKRPISFEPLGYAPNHGAHWERTARGAYVPLRCSEVGEITYDDGSKRRGTRSSYASERSQAEEREAALQTVGKVMAGYSEESGAFIGVIKSVHKSHRVLVTRGGVRLKVGLLGLEEFTYEEWDARLEAAKIECPALGLGAPKFTL